MITVPVRHAIRPPITYSGNPFELAQEGRVQWNLQRLKFLQRSAGRLSKRILLIIPVKSDNRSFNDSTTTIFGRECVEQLIESFLDYGRGPNESSIKPKNFTIDIEILRIQDGQSHEDDFNRLFTLAKAKTPSTDLAMLFSPTKGGLPDVFGDFKRTAETRHGLQTICIAAKAANDSKNRKHPKTGKFQNLLPQFMGNVSMKLNLKLGNINHSFELSETLRDLLFVQPEVPKQEGAVATMAQPADLKNKKIVDTMILGGDVSHPLKGSADPSIAAIVGSVDKYFAKYLGSVRYQQGETEVSDAQLLYLDSS